ncbi:hypothetical protein BU16DRAFT_536771 [Lophium mytilinum]|uniref:Uncharacterized protein n=1 Tax=Lophium mytilinum TaxID=390894 RepID=A0A6A6R4S3_9PEZI|nr:hypothetical protein BU16DRAFT_536771 [Lophium mytilinum]
MPGPTLLTLPAELRQQIITETIFAEVTDDGYEISTPLSGVCKTLQADIDDVLPIWLPSTSASSVILTTNKAPVNGRGFRSLKKELKKRATRRIGGGAWSGISAITIRAYEAAPYYTIFNTFEPVRLTQTVREFRWHSGRRSLPASIKRVEFDLRIDSASLQALQQMPMGNQKDWWCEDLWTVTKCIERYTDVTFEVAGRLPESQVDALLHRQRKGGVHYWYWKQVYANLEKDHFAGFLGNVREARERLKIEEEAERQRKMEMKKYKKEFGKRMAELKKRKQEKNGDLSTAGGKRLKEDQGDVDGVSDGSFLDQPSMPFRSRDSLLDGPGQ